MKKLLPLLALAFLFPSLALAGSQTFSTPGNYSFAVPNYTGTLTVEVWGGGGGGYGGPVSQNCNTVYAGASSWNNTVIAGGGARGNGFNCDNLNGAGGIASGGGTNINGNSGSGQFYRRPFRGGDAPYGGVGAVCGIGIVGRDLTKATSRETEAPGGGGCPLAVALLSGGAGGSGAYSKIIYTSNTLAYGATVPVVVGAGGLTSQGNGYLSRGRSPNGAHGAVKITWDDAAPPPPPPSPLSCSITFDKNPITSGEGTVMRWMSTGSPDVFYMNTIGSVGASGSTSVSPSATTDYSGTVYKCPSGATLNSDRTQCVSPGGSGGAGGSRTFSAPGNHTFNVPAYGTLTVTVNGAGGGGGAYWAMDASGRGQTGESSSFNGMVIGNGGGGGMVGNEGMMTVCTNGANGTPGTSVGGSVSNTSGGGAVGGVGGTSIVYCVGLVRGGIGGAGGRAVSTYATGVLMGTVTIVVGKGGVGGGGGSSGSNGSVVITWTAPSAPTSVPPQTAQCPAVLTVGIAACTVCPTGYITSGNACACPTGQAPNQNGQCVDDTITPPTITANGACTVGVAHSYTLRSTDTITTSTIHYGLDWNNDRVVDEWVPQSGYVPQGTSRSVSHTWATAGAHTFRALAEDSTGKRSAWSTHTVACIGTGVCTPGFICQESNRCEQHANCSITGCIPCDYGCSVGACNLPPVPRVLSWKVLPLLLQKGRTTKVTWEVTNAISCVVTSTGGDTWNGLSSIVGGQISKPILSQTIFTLHCIPLTGLPLSAWVDQKATVNIAPVFKEQ